MKTFAEAAIEARNALAAQLMELEGESDIINAVADLRGLSVNDTYFDDGVYVNPDDLKLFAGEGGDHATTICDDADEAQRLMTMPDSDFVKAMEDLMNVDPYLEDHLVDAMECQHKLIARMINENEQEIWGEFDGEVLWISNAREEEGFRLITDDWAELEDIVSMHPRLFAVKFADRLRA